MNTEFHRLHSVFGRAVAGGAANNPQISYIGIFVGGVLFWANYKTILDVLQD